MSTDILDLDTQYQVKKAAPVVTNVTRDGAEKVVSALNAWTDSHDAQKDVIGKLFWQASLMELIERGALNIEPQPLGRILRSLSLSLWRKGDGYHVAWSADQLSILKKYFSN